MNRIFFVLLLAAAMAATGCSKQVNEKAKFIAKLTPIKYTTATTSAPATGPASAPATPPAESAASTMPESTDKGSGEASFEMNAKGTGLHYVIKVDRIADVTGASILVAGRDGPVVELAISHSGPASGQLAEGLIVNADLRLPPKDRLLETLLADFLDKKATLVVYTRKHPKGELSGPNPPRDRGPGGCLAGKTTGRPGSRREGVPAGAIDRPGSAGRCAETREYYLDLAVLAGNPHRLAGFENGSRAASQFVENRLKAMGIAKVAVQEFPLVQPRNTDCRLLVDGREVPSSNGKPAIYAARGNMFQESITPAEGLSGQAVYLGRADWASTARTFRGTRSPCWTSTAGANGSMPSRSARRRSFLSNPTAAWPSRWSIRATGPSRRTSLGFMWRRRPPTGWACATIPAPGN